MKENIKPFKENEKNCLEGDVKNKVENVKMTVDKLRDLPENSFLR